MAILNAGEGDDKGKILESAKKILYKLILATAIAWIASALLGLDVGGGEVLYDANGDPEKNTAGEILCKGLDTTTPKVPCGGSLASCKGSNANIADCLVGVEGAIANAIGSVLDIFKYILLAAAIGMIVVLRVKTPYVHVR